MARRSGARISAPFHPDLAQETKPRSRVCNWSRPTKRPEGSSPSRLLPQIQNLQLGGVGKKIRGQRVQGEIIQVQLLQLVQAGKEVGWQRSQPHADPVPVLNTSLLPRGMGEGPSLPSAGSATGSGRRSGEFRHADATVPAQVEALVADTLARHGSVDILVNGAAYQTETGPVAEVTEQEWDSGLNLFLKAPFLGCKYAIPAMLKGDGGVIINISSAVVLRGSTFSLPYSVAKAGIIQLTKTTNSQYCRQGVRVNCILPGVIDTPGSRRVSASPSIAATYADGIPVGRMGQPEDVARLALYLASDDAEYVAGASFLIDGGINNL